VVIIALHLMNRLNSIHS
jgi:serine/threonine protein kinase